MYFIIFIRGINTKPYSSCNLLLFIVVMEVINDIHSEFVVITIMNFCWHGINCMNVLLIVNYIMSKVLNIYVMVVCIFNVLVFKDIPIRFPADIIA